MASTMIASQITHIPGILLNPTHRRFSPPPQSLSRTTSIHYLLASSASSTSSSSTSLKLSDSPSTPSGRKIRFAPLPDPRKLEEEDDAASETSLSDEDPKAPDPDGCKLLSSTCSSPEVAYDNISNGYSNGPNMALSNPPSKPASSAWKFFKPRLPNKKKQEPKDPYALFRATSSESIHSTQSLSLPRSSRRYSISSSTFDAGSTTGSINSQERAAILSHTSPLTHSVSEGGGPAARRSLSSLDPQSRSGRRLPRPQLMLNGRVYGRKRASLKMDPFQNQRAFEPEFSEWGSGGLGSVPSNRASGAAADWDRLHGGKSFAKAHDDDDDGSGMVWVKKRRQEREQAARERAAQERLAAETAAAPKEEGDGDAEQIAAAATPGEQERGVSAIGTESGAAGDPNAKTISPPGSPLTAQAPPSASPALSHVPLTRTPSAPTQALDRSLEHNTSVQVLPPQPHTHGLHNHQKKHSVSSLNYRLNISRVSSNDSGTIRGVPSGQVTPTASTSRELFPQIKEGVNSEEASEESSNEDEDDEDDDEEDELDVEVGCARRTAACAGVEKISRHREHPDQ